MRSDERYNSQILVNNEIHNLQIQSLGSYQLHSSYIHGEQSNSDSVPIMHCLESSDSVRWRMEQRVGRQMCNHRDVSTWRLNVHPVVLQL